MMKKYFQLRICKGCDKQSMVDISGYCLSCNSAEEEKEFENLINYEPAKEWLKKQRNVNVDGCMPRNIVMEILDVAAKIADGQYRDIEEAESDLYAILS